MKKKSLIVLTGIYLIAVFLRLYTVNNYHFPFWFDLGRDAIISRQILENKDLKIQGPSASGTQDSVFHGVLYYYLIGPLYTFFDGNPQLVLNTLILLTSLTILPVFLIGKNLSGKNSVGLLAAFLYAVSYDAIRGNVWLSNPIIASVSIPTFFYLLYLVFFKNKLKLWPLLALSLAITHQSVILFVSLWGVVLASFVFAAQNKKFNKQLNLKLIITGLIVYLLGIASMILAQLLAMRAGIFNPLKLGEYAEQSLPSLKIILGSFTLFLEKYSQLFFPSLPLLSLLTVIFLGYFIWNLKKSSQKIYLILGLTFPLWLLSWHFRNMYHSFLGMEGLALVLFAWGLLSLPKLKYRQIIISLILVIFVFSNLKMLQTERNGGLSYYFVPQGSFLKDQLALIDYTYSQSNGEQFSISTFTNPNGYNTLWAYLYSWYGENKYGYTPQFFGPSQAGLFGDNLLEAAATPSAHHFSISEPTEGIPIWLIQDFAAQQQEQAGPILNTQKFGELVVEER